MRLEEPNRSFAGSPPCLKMVFAAGARKAMDALTRQGASRYGHMPRFGRAENEYCRIREEIRFAFSKYNKTTVLTRCTDTRPPRGE
ncbi:MAG: hypothetical protein LBO82_04005 [Synergistaceae bacterium]|jgi:hypothetical protein|nr:hypothetical protein [Synergistaceae bacterium]